MVQGPAAQSMHEEEVKTLIAEALQAKEAGHAANLHRLRQDYTEQLSESEADLKERDRCNSCASFVNAV